MVKLYDIALKIGHRKQESSHFFDIYDSILNKYCNNNINLLEIGIGQAKDSNDGGHSLKMWGEYFPNGHLYGLDIYKKNITFNSRTHIFQGSQVDREILSKIHQQSGDFDIIIDDGSHTNAHQIETFKILFPKLKNGGVYFIEDVQTSYYLSDGGDGFYLKNNKTAINFFKNIVDKIHQVEHENPYSKSDYFSKNITEIRFYLNLIMIKKDYNSTKSHILIKNQKPVTGTSIIILRKVLKKIKYNFHFLRSRIYYLIDFLKL
jgi:hypothetical protein